MISIKLGHSLSHISGFDDKTNRVLRKALSYTLDNTFGGGFPQTKYLLDARGFFPTGLLNRVKRTLKALGHAHHIALPQDTPVMPIAWRMDLGGITPYADQTAAVDKAYAKGRGLISMPTGTGKSLVIGLLVQKFQCRTLIVVPTLELKKQLSESLHAWFGRSPHLRVENIDSKSLQKLNNFDLLIVDESHHVASRTYQNLNKKVWPKIRHRFFLTATPYRNVADEQLLFEGIAGEVIHKITYQHAVSQGYIVPVDAFYVESPKQPTDADTWARVYSELVVRNRVRNELIARLMQALDAPTLCLVKEVAHGKALSDLTGVPFVNGQEEDSRDYIRQFNAGEITQLIGTNGVLGEGVDSRPCEYVIVAGLGKAKSAFQQQVGRAVRRYKNKESAKVILIKDTSHKFTARHYNAQKAILIEEYGVTPLKLDI